jgi:hypothetical protein
MGSFSDYTETHVLDHIVGKTSFTMPTCYIGLSDTDPEDSAGNWNEPSGGSYARVATDSDDWNAADLDGIDNAQAITFPESTAAWLAGNPLTHFAGWDAASNGNMLFHGTLTQSRVVDASGITLSFAAGSLVITLD